MPYPDELRTQESVMKDRRHGPDGDSRPLDEPLEPEVEAALDEERGFKIEERLRQQDRAGVGGGGLD